MSAARKYPFGPLAAALCMTEAQACRELGIAGATQQEYRRVGMSERVADRMAVKAGKIAYEVWPDMLDDNIAAAQVPCRDCSTPFIPTRPWNVFCSPACQRRAAGREHQRRRRADPAVREADRAYKRAYYAENTEYLNRQNRAYHWEHRERLLEAQREYKRRRKAAA